MRFRVGWLPVAGVLVASWLFHGSPALASPASTSALVSSLFPATFQEVQKYWGPTLEFEGNISQYIFTRCMKADGFTTEAELGPSRPSAPPINELYSQFPDVALYKSGSLAIPKPIPSSTPSAALTPDIPANVLPAWKADSKVCEAKSGAPFKQLTNELTPMLTAWSNETGPQVLPTIPSVEQATRKWSTCVGDAGYPAKSLSDFMNKYVVQDIELPAGAADVNNNPQVEKLAKLYGNCVAPVADAMDQVRLKARQRLLQQYALQLDSIAAQIDKRDAKLAAQYGVQAPRFVHSH